MEEQDYLDMYIKIKQEKEVLQKKYDTLMKHHIELKKFNDNVCQRMTILLRDDNTKTDNIKFDD